MRELEVIVPVLNEQGSVRELVERVDKVLKSARIGYGIIFVDDNSTDNTVRRIKSLRSKYPIRLLTKKGKRGKAYSILEGAKAAKAETLAMIDGDLQYPPEALAEMYRLSKNNGVVVANRRKNGISKIRKLGSDASTNLVGKLILGINCDAQSGLKVFRREIIEQITENDVKPWALDMPLLYTARAMGYKIGAVEIDFARRVKGSSKVNFLKTAYEIIVTALSLRLVGKKTYLIRPQDGHPTLGAGVIHKTKKYVTHTNLPHAESALVTLVRWQRWALLVGVSLFLVGMLINYLATLVVLVALLSAIYFSDVLFSGWVLLKSLHFPPELKFSKKDISRLDAKKLPIYTILCPLYKEGRVLGEFVDSIKKLDWPKEKLDVLILLEEDDEETLNIAKKLELPGYIRVAVVPDSQPRTKPKACNYGLTLAKGEYVVVYDAEDKPDPLQLKKAYLGFRKLGNKVFCLQSKLNYYNPNHNLLTRLFTAEYSLWFDVILPGLQSIEASIPLGGTSNHFRTKELVALHAWDPFNVTEDCDLGVRIFKSGGRTAIIDSTTLEEANSSVRNWIRQRSRWIKGYIQTYLVHMRHPARFVRRHGVHALVFQLIIGMRMSFMLINPFLWVMTISYFAFRRTLGPAIESLYPAPVFYIAAFALVAGNFMYVYNYMIGCAKRGHWGVVKYVFVVPVYWILASIAAFKAVNQLIFKPHFWEKTHHGLHLPAKSGKKKYSFGLTLSFPRLATSRIGWKVNTQVSSGALFVAAAVFANFMNFLTSTYLGRTLAPEEFALISLMTSFLFIAQLPSNAIGSTVSHQTAFLFGKSGAVPAEIWKKYKTKFVSLSLVMSLVWLLATPLLIGFFNSHTIVPFVAFAPMWIILILGSVSGGFLNGLLKFQFLALLVSLESMSKLVLSIIFVQAGWASLVYVTLPLSLFLSLAASLWFAGRLSRGERQGQKVIEVRFPRKFFVVSVLTSMSSISFLSLDLIFVKHFLSAVEAGHYALLVLAGRMVYMVGSLFSQFILPVVSRAEGAMAKSGGKFVRLLLLVFLSTFFVFLIVGPLGATTVPILFGARASAVVPYLTPFAFSMILFSLAYSVVIYHQAKKEYGFVIPGVLTVMFMASGLYFFHQDISHVVGVMFASSVFFLSMSVALHVFYGKLKIVANNVHDLIGLFVIRLNGKKALPEGKLRILMYNWRDTKHVWAGGAETYVHELAKRWVEDGHYVTLFCGNDGRAKREEAVDGVKVLRRGGFYTVYLWAFLYYLVHFRRKFDMIIESENGVPFFTPLYSTKPKILIVHHVHQEVFRNHLSFPLSAIAIFVERFLMPAVYRGKKIVAVSESTKKEIARMGIGKEEDIEVVSPGVDIARFYKSRKTEYPSFVYLGRHKAYKNIDVAIRAFSKVLKKYSNARLIIAGEGEKTAELKGLAWELGIRKSVYFAGKVTEEEKVRILGKSWVAIQPSSFEGWGITVVEANACGTPVIASKVSGLSDSVVDGKTGLLVPLKNIEILRDAMIGLVEDGAFRSQMSEEALKWAQVHDWREKSDVFMDVVRKVLGKDRELALEGDISPNPSYLYEEE